MNINSKNFRVPPGKKVDLSKWPTIVDPYYTSKKEYKVWFAKIVNSREMKPMAGAPKGLEFVQDWHHDSVVRQNPKHISNQLVSTNSQGSSFRCEDGESTV
jgi:hypothetical protein